MEESLIPDSPIMIQYESDDDEDIEAQERQGLVKPPPPAYGRWRGSRRLDPDLLHWQRVEGATEGVRNASIDGPPVYASPLRIDRLRTARDEDDRSHDRSDTVEIGRAL